MNSQINMVLSQFETFLNMFILKSGNHVSFFGINLINTADLIELAVRFGFNTFLIFVIVHFLYARTSKRKDYYFSYIAIGIVVFFMCFLLNSVKLEMGFALGLFAVFGIIRYRTDAIPIKEMTYLFIVIGVSVVNALVNKKVSYAEVLFTNFIIIGGLWLLEKRISTRQESTVNLIYEKIENIHLQSEEELLNDLRARTGIDVSRYEIKRIDFLKDVAEVDIFFFPK